jgi:hypothetical protein
MDEIGIHIFAPVTKERAEEWSRTPLPKEFMAQKSTSEVLASVFCGTMELGSVY